MPRLCSCKDRIIHEMIRVNHAGEYGACRIYQGQLFAIRNSHDRLVIEKMLHQEEKHLNYFNHELCIRGVRRSVLLPFWYVSAYMLGLCSALCGIKTAMLVTQAVEEVIEDHYQQQIDYLEHHNIEHDLRDNIKQFQKEEVEHLEIAINHDSQKSPFSYLTAKLIKIICLVAITVSKKL